MDQQDNISMCQIKTLIPPGCACISRRRPELGRVTLDSTCALVTGLQVAVHDLRVISTLSDAAAAL